jgi:uncharacterized protein
MDVASPHLPRPAPIEAYGKGGFRFAHLSHRGSLLCRPDGIWASAVKSVGDLTPGVLGEIVDALPPVDLFLIGSGAVPWLLPAELRAAFRARHIPVDAMTSDAAIRTYNVLLAENRRVGALLIAVD